MFLYYVLSEPIRGISFDPTLFLFYKCSIRDRYCQKIITMRKIIVTILVLTSFNCFSQKLGVSSGIGSSILFSERDNHISPKFGLSRSHSIFYTHKPSDKLHLTVELGISNLEAPINDEYIGLIKVNPYYSNISIYFSYIKNKFSISSGINHFRLRYNKTQNKSLYGDYDAHLLSESYSERLNNFLIKLEYNVFNFMSIGLINTASIDFIFDSPKYMINGSTLPLYGKFRPLITTQLSISFYIDDLGDI